MCVSGLDVLRHEQVSKALPRTSACISRISRPLREFFFDFSTDGRPVRVFVA
jgi:hypothetical protein